ncbi:MAG TPA: VIT1/CCC1 transporter family protein [Actinomycetota bacterium]|nr:VIT1/CCC1 transporter family protein [Actinomycetota bacterium]
MAELTPEDHRTKADLPRLLDARRRITRRGADLRPHPGPVHDETPTGMGKSGALRAAIFGINDGLVSNTALIMGFAGASQSRAVIVLAGISGLLAGAFSMGAGEYVSMRVQRELLERMLHLEAHELGSDPEGEKAELAYLYRKKGISDDLARRMSEEVMRDPQVALDTHAREELGIDPDEGLGSPWGAAISSFCMFALGALVPLIPFFFAQGDAAVIASLVLAAVAIAVVGGLTSLLTGRGVVYSALRMLGLAAAATLVTYAIGRAIGATIS